MKILNLFEPSKIFLTMSEMLFSFCFLKWRALVYQGVLLLAIIFLSATGLEETGPRKVISNF